jgi:hypothetical protein
MMRKASESGRMDRILRVGAIMTKDWGLDRSRILIMKAKMRFRRLGDCDRSHDEEIWNSGCVDRIFRVGAIISKEELGTGKE